MWGWRCRNFAFFVAAVTIVLSASMTAGDRVNVRGLGMARSAAAVARGLDAVGVNPANLSLSDGGILTFTILPLGAAIGSDLFTYDLYSSYFDNRSSFTDLPESDKRLILSSFENSVSTSHADATARLFGVLLRVDANNALAFTIDYGLAGAVSLPKEYMRMLMYGNVRSEVFQFDGAKAKAYWARTYSLSYGAMLPSPPFLRWLSGGVGLKMVQGYGYYEVEQLSASLQTGYAELLSGNVTWRARSAGAENFTATMNEMFESPLGYGFGVDVGIAGAVNDFLSFGVSVTDIGGIRWTKNVESFSLDETVLDVNPNVFNNMNSLERAFSEKKNSGGAFTSTLPSMVRTGVSIQVDKIAGQVGFPGSLLVGLDYSQGIGADSPLLEPPRVSLGVEYRPLQWLPIRTGFSFSNNTNSNIAFGVGLNFRGFDLDLGTENVLTFFNSRNASFGSVGVGMRFRIPTNYAAR